MAQDLGVGVISYSPLALGLLTGKYSSSSLPPGPRGTLFKGLLQDTAPLLEVLRLVAKERRKKMSQVGQGVEGRGREGGCTRALL